MQKARVTISNPLGIHIRVAVELAEMLKQSESSVVFIDGEDVINAKDPFAVLNASLMQGTTIQIQVQGNDEESVLNSVVTLIRSQKE